MSKTGSMPERFNIANLRVLLAATNRWPLTARLASGFSELGCSVAAVCPLSGHPIKKVRGVKQVFRYAGWRPIESLRAAIDAFAPDIIVPLCDRSVQHLHELHALCAAEGEYGQRIRALIERSLGPADGYSIVSSRYDLLMLARDAGIRVPETIQVDTADDLKAWERRPPWLLKANGTWGGRGVRLAENRAASEQALSQLTTRATPLGLMQQLLLNRDRDWIISSWKRARPGIIAQAIVDGRPANCAVVCWKGEVLAGIAVEVLRADGPWHPAIVVQVVEGHEMLEAATRIARRLHLTGFFGLDFMIEDGTGKLFLIEMNPRCTPPCSLNLGESRDLLAAIWAKLADQQIPHRNPITQKSRIAYFPQAMLRSADSADICQLDSAYLDVPESEPELVQELLHPWSERSVAGRLLDILRGRPAVNRAFPPHVFNVAQPADVGIVPQPEMAQPVEMGP